MAKDFAKSKCFIKTDNGYEEITYEELLRREEADPSYKGRRFLPLHGMLMEVTLEQYRDFYKERRRQKYLYERSRENRDISIDMFTTEQFNGADILVSDGMDIEEQVTYKLLLDKLHSCLSLLTDEEQEINNDIRRTLVDPTEIIGKIGETVFGDLYPGKKYRYKNGDSAKDNKQSEA